MSFVKRRRFLQLVGLTLTSIGLSQQKLEQQFLTHLKFLAQDTPRKRALLVGINRYVDLGYQWSRLRGAVNDTILQKELLIRGFGFEPNAILTLIDEQATRPNILQAFEEHLIHWAKPGDVVVFHFSGHGSQVAEKCN